MIIDRAPKFANPANFVVEPLYKTAPLTPAEGEDPFNRKQVEALCRAVCKVEGVDPDDDTFGDGCDPAWTRYADAVAEVLWHTPVDCSCARAGFPGSCDNCDVDSGPVKFWRDRAERAEAQVEDVQRKLIEANNKLIDINHALLNREDPDWKVLAAARSASLTSTVGRPNE